MREFTLLFDFDGTLVRLDKRTAYSQVVADYGSGDVSWLADSLYNFDKTVCAEGKADRRAVFEKYIDGFRTKNVEDLCRAFWTQIAQRQTLKPHCVEMLSIFEANGYVLVCVTDTDGTGGNKRNRIQVAIPERFFGNRIFIGTENIPHAKDRTKRYVEAVVAELQVDPALCVMIGDKVEVDLVPAKAIGMHTILVKNDEYGGTWRDGEVEELLDLIPKVKRLESGGRG